MNVDFIEEAGTAASQDHIIVRLQTLEAADQVHNASVPPVVVNVRSGIVRLVLEIPPTLRSGRPVVVSAAGVQSHMSVSLTHVSPRWIAEFVVPVVPRAAHPSSQSCAGAYGGSFTGARMHRSSHILGQKQERMLGGWVVDGPLVVLMKGDSNSAWCNVSI